MYAHGRSIDRLLKLIPLSDNRIVTTAPVTGPTNEKTNRVVPNARKPFLIRLGPIT